MVDTNGQLKSWIHNKLSVEETVNDYDATDAIIENPPPPSHGPRNVQIWKK